MQGHSPDNLQHSNLSESSPTKWNKFYRARVVDAKDPRMLGRVKVSIPDLMPEDQKIDPYKEGLWAHPGNNYLGGRNEQDTTAERLGEDSWYQGSCLIPPQGSWVWLFFEDGDINRPYYLGSLEAGQQKVLPENQYGYDYHKKWTLIKTRLGKCIILSDDESDGRVEITGKKRLLTNPPNGDEGSIFVTDDNQTTILIDERKDQEKVVIKDYRGNHITLHQDTLVQAADPEDPESEEIRIQDSLHVYVKGDMEYEAEGDIKFKAGGKFEVRADGDIKASTGNNMDLFANNKFSETAYAISRLAFTLDNRTACLGISDYSAIYNARTAGVMHTDYSLIEASRTAGMSISDSSSFLARYTSGMALFQNAPIVSKAATGVMALWAPSISLTGTVTAPGLIPGIPGPIVEAVPAFTIYLPLTSFISALAESALPDGERRQGTDEKIETAEEPIVPEEKLIAPESQIFPPVIGDDYEIATGSTIVRPPADTIVPDTPPLFAPPQVIPRGGAGSGGTNATTGGGGDEYSEEKVRSGECVLSAGVGHLFALSLKDEYREKIIPLVDASYGKCTSFSILKNPYLAADSEFMDPTAIPVYDDYTTPSTLTDIDDTTKWWQNLDSFCAQAKTYDILVVPTLFDFMEADDPLVDSSDGLLYGDLTWDDTTYGHMVKKVIEHIKDSEVEFLMNIGYRQNRTSIPSSNWLRSLAYWIVNECGVSSNRLALSSTLFNRNPYFRYRTFYNPESPNEDQINVQERVDDEWGGTGRVYVYDEAGNLADGYVKYLIHSCEGIAPMCNWRMNEYVSTLPGGITTTHPNVMNYIFAPRQREALRAVFQEEDDTNDGFIDFS